MWVDQSWQKGISGFHEHRTEGSEEGAEPEDMGRQTFVHLPSLAGGWYTSVYVM